MASLDMVIDLTKTLQESIVNTINDTESYLRKELVRLGWTPPAVQQNTVYYELGTESGQEYIRCKACDLKSFHPEDIKHRYCGNCRKFHGQ